MLFKLTNNTRWAIELDMGKVPKEHGDAKLFYAVLSKDDEILSGSTKCRVCSFNFIRPGKSITFSVSADQVEKSRSIRISYFFKWEKVRENGTGTSSEHFVRYYFHHLPEIILPKENNY